MYIVGFAEILLVYIAGDELAIFDMATESGRFNNYRIVGTCVLVISAIIVSFGVGIVTGFSIIALVCVFIAILSIYVGLVVYANGKEDTLFCQVGSRIVLLDDINDCVMPTGGKVSKGFSDMFCRGDPGISYSNCSHYLIKNIDTVTKKMAFPGIMSGTLFENIYNVYGWKNEAITWGYGRDDYLMEEHDKGYMRSLTTVNFLVAIGIFFPSVTGIMAGSNRSGDLSNPSFSIPLGTIAVSDISM